ncbi:MAG: radical SAM protein [Gemmatimonadaceae bacterium]|nr:radical SAM protein [Gemmatimonadaceae bacterium]
MTTSSEHRDHAPPTRRVLRVLAEPVRAESRALLAANWALLPPELRTSQQMLGRQGNGCGATIGAMPRCGFACRGCYLGEAANRIPAEPVEAIMAQMRALRPVLGPDGNLQLTDGEVTLRPPHEVVQLLQYAHSLELVPMLMTHGDSFRRRPGLLERYLREGRLAEVSIHVDTTQRGRVGAAYRHATDEASLNPLRDEFVALLSAAQAATGRSLRAATTMTVTRENLGGVPDVLRWLVGGQPVFRMISFQPIAQVGRTEDGFGGGVSADVLWQQVALTLTHGDAAAADALLRSQVWFGHPACNRILHGLVAQRDGAAPVFHAARPAEGDPQAETVVAFFARFGGVSFKTDTRRTALARAVGMALRAPRFVLGRLPGYVRHWLDRLDAGHPMRALRDLLAGRLRVQPLVIVSHHFMSADELQTPDGQVRLAHCVFQVPVNGVLTSMCQVNALGGRDAYYAGLAHAGDAVGAG